MKTRFTRRFAAAVAVTAAAVVGAAVQTGPANAETVYWTFKNRQTGKCLTAGSSDVVWATSCNGSSSQQWDWIASNYSGGWKLLKSRSTGLCLRTDAKTTKNATWQSACDRDATGELFFYYADLQELTTGNELYLAMDSGSSGGVYTTSYFGDSGYAYWSGTHT
ncbi:hypothetical protein GCM10023196_056140 [Actinoallomurus vinaceus]|uniref:Ricin B lectin domain-containing protein n=1 Tax=Actinoallomurus vinaceus TaxID=1080074 RepID=A0ABP8UGE3_9ACTN